MDALGLLVAAQSGTLSGLTFGYAPNSRETSIPYRSFIIVFPGMVGYVHSSTAAMSETSTILSAGMTLSWIYGTIRFTGAVIYPNGLDISFAYLT